MADIPNQMTPVRGVPQQMRHMFQPQQLPPDAEPFSRQGMNQYGPSVKRIGKGSLIWFRYLNYQHDPAPLVIVTDIWQNYIRGVNLHYLTFNFVRHLLNLHCDNRMFSYAHIKNESPFFVSAFRTYKRLGIKQIKSLDCAFLLNVLASVKSFDPAEVEQMRVYVREQIRRQPNKKAEAMSERYMGMQRGEEGFQQPAKSPLPPGEANI